MVHAVPCSKNPVFFSCAERRECQNDIELVHVCGFAGWTSHKMRYKQWMSLCGVEKGYKDFSFSSCSFFYISESGGVQKGSASKTCPKIHTDVSMRGSQKLEKPH
jgi:hypothetical protein